MLDPELFADLIYTLFGSFIHCVLRMFPAFAPKVHWVHEKQKLGDPFNFFRLVGDDFTPWILHGACASHRFDEVSFKDIAGS